MRSFYEILTEAVSDIAEHGYDNAERVERWMSELRLAAEREMISPERMQELLTNSLVGIYRRLVDQAKILKQHQGISRFTLERVKPKLRSELDRRIMASAQLIKLNRAAAIEKTLQRFQGWSTSIPIGGTDLPGRTAEKQNIRKALVSLPFEERRVLIDQGHKLTASINDILAADGGAIAGIWRSHGKNDPSYNYRPDHLDRDGHVYLIRGNWAQEAGLVKVGPSGYTDQITMAGEQIYCRCWYIYVYALRDLPDEMLTAKGRAQLHKVRVVA